MTLDLSALRRAITAMEKAAAVYDSVDKNNVDLVETVRAGVVQSFEFTYELCWKFIKRWLEANYGSSQIDGISRQELFRQAAESKIISNVERWMDYHKARNRTSHIYDLAISIEVFEVAKLFLNDAICLLTELEKRND